MKNIADKEISELTRNIQAARLRVSDISSAIGKKYYEQKKDAPEAEYVQMFNDMRAAENQIEQMETRIKFLNGIVVCTNCKTDNSVNSSFCAACGSRLPHTYTADGANRCSRCGNIINPGQLFCGNCGQKVENVQQPAAQAPIAQQPAAQAPVAQPAAVQEAVPSAEQVQPIAPEAVAQPEEQIQPVIQAEAEQTEESRQTAEAVCEAAAALSGTESISQGEAARCCPSCGAPVKAADALFCAECGTKLR